MMLVAPALVFVLAGSSDGHRSAGAAAPAHARGWYVEARTASVFAGACHFNGEYTTQGREAVLAWAFSEGGVDGYSLAGVHVVATVVADRNLAEPEAVRRSVLFLPATLGQEAGARIENLLAREYRSVLGQVVGVRRTDVAVRCDGEAYSVRAGELVALAGVVLPDRACCAQPFQVWYEPLVPVRGAIVGCSENFRCAERTLAPPWDRRGENNAFFGEFRLGAR